MSFDCQIFGIAMVEPKRKMYHHLQWPACIVQPRVTIIAGSCNRVRDRDTKVPSPAFPSSWNLDFPCSTRRVLLSPESFGPRTIPTLRHIVPERSSLYIELL